MGIVDSADYAELVALPAHLIGEIVGGTLYASARPSCRSVLAASALGALLGASVHVGPNSPDMWWVLRWPELHLGEDVLVPDLAAWRRERMPEVPDESFFSLPPDWVSEVVSPNSAKLDLAMKVPRYAAAGVPYAWIVRPSLEALEIFDLRSGLPVLAGAFAGSEFVRAPPFLKVEVELALLWGRSGQSTERPQSPRQ